MTATNLARRVDSLEQSRRIHAPWQYWPDAALLAVITGEPGAQLTDDELRRVVEGGTP